MAGDATADLLARGEAALRDCTFEDARAAFSEALAQVETPEGFDGMARALWWLRDVEKAVANRERAYADFRRAGDLERAASIAMWLSREYAQALGNDAISRGWLARAEGLVAKLPGSAAEGRLALARGRLAADASLARSAAEGALEIAREVGDPEVFGDVCCLATRAGEESGEIARLMQWNSVVMGFMQRSGHVPLLEFCGTCCAEVLVAGGNLEEAARLLAGLEDRPDALRAAAMLHLEAGETSVAAALLHRRLNQVGGPAALRAAGPRFAPTYGVMIDT